MSEKPSKQETQADLRSRGLNPKDWDKSIRRVENPALYAREELRRFVQEIMPDVQLTFDESIESNGSSLLLATRRLTNDEIITFPVGVIDPRGKPYSYFMPFQYGWRIGSDLAEDE